MTEHIRAQNAVMAPERTTGPMVDIPGLDDFGVSDSDTDAFGRAIEDWVDWDAIADPWGLYLDPKQSRSDPGVCNSVQEVADVPYHHAMSTLKKARRRGESQKVKTCTKESAQTMARILRASPHHVRCRADPIEAPRDVV